MAYALQGGRAGGGSVKSLRLAAGDEFHHSRIPPSLKIQKQLQLLQRFIERYLSPFRRTKVSLANADIETHVCRSIMLTMVVDDSTPL